MTQASFNELSSTKKGVLAEKLVEQRLRTKGWVIYRPGEEDGAHGFDILTMKQKKDLMIVEVKAKARRNKLPDTGIDTRLYKEYVEVSMKHNLKVFLVFVDEFLGKVYGNYISKLSETYEENNVIYPLIEKTKNGKEIIYFPLSNMKDLFKLDDSVLTSLKELSTRSYDYR